MHRRVARASERTRGATVPPAATHAAGHQELRDSRRLARAKAGVGPDPSRASCRGEALAPANRRDQVGASLSYTRIVREAAPAADVEPDFLELQWRILSGLTHGAQWATLGVLDRTTKLSAVDGVVHVRFTGSPETLALQALQVLQLVDIAEAAFTDRAAAPAGTTG